MNVMTKRGISLLMTLCMVLGLVYLPGGITAQAAIDELYSAAIQSDSLDTASEGVPTGWGKRGYPSANAVTEQGRTYFHMSLASGNSRAAQATNFALEDGAIYTNAVLKYDFMLDNSSNTGEWSVQLPAFVAAAGGNNLGLTNVTQAMTLGTKSLTHGQWYTVEVVLLEGSYLVYVDGEQAVPKTNIYNYSTNTMKLVQFGIFNGATETVTLNVDNLAIYNYVPDAALTADAASVDLNVGASVTPAWTKTADAYLASVTFESSDKTVATVDADGKITAVAGGVATITATPNAASGMAAATVQVNVQGNVPDLSNLISDAVYSHAMDSQTGGVPTDWTKASSSYPSADIVDGAFRMKHAGGDKIYFASVQPEGFGYSAAALKYDFRVDSSNQGKEFDLYLPAFTNGARNRAVGITLTETMTLGSKDDFAYDTWYTAELVLVDRAWSLYINGTEVLSNTAATDPVMVNMGLVAANGCTMDIDNFEMYTHAADAAFSASKSTCEVNVGEKADIKWSKTVGAYLSAVTFESDKPGVASVDADGVVTGVAAGTATITATPAAASGMAPVTVTVTVKSGDVHVHDFTTGTCSCGEVAEAKVGEAYYETVAEAVAAAGTNVVVLNDNVDTITVEEDKTLNLDLNGHNVAALEANGIVYGSDSSTKDYTNETYGKITNVTGEGLANIHYTDGATAKTGYVTDSADGYSFHHFEVKIASVTLRAEASGIGYKLYMAGNARVKALLNAEDAYGVTVYISGNEENGESASAKAEDFVSGASKLVMIENILSTENNAATNASYGAMEICVKAYIQFGNEKVEVSFADGKCLKDLLAQADTNYASYDPEQQAGLVSFYNTYIKGNTDAFEGWTYTNIATAAAQN